MRRYFILVVLALSLVGCTDPIEETEPRPDCTTDDDCAEGYGCEDSECRPRCSEDHTCDLPCDTTCPEPEPMLRFVMITELSEPICPPPPNPCGTDVDAIQLVKSDGTIIAAQTVEAVEYLGRGSTAPYPEAVLGPADAECDLTNERQFYALGGVQGGYIIVAFANAPVEVGDMLHVVEIGRTECGMYDDDAFRVEVGVSTDPDDFREVGECFGSCTLLVE